MTFTFKSRPIFRYQTGWQGRVPELLRDRDQWVLWRYGWRNGKWTKIPYQAHRPAREASTTDPQTWNPFAAAVDAFEKAAGSARAFDGIGFVFAHGGGLVGFDLDGVVLADGQIDPWGLEYLALLMPTYHEISPSRKGIKGVAFGELPGPGINRRGLGPGGQFGFEMYDSGRFFTITGDSLGTGAIEDRSGAILDLYRRFKPEPHKNNGDVPHGPPLAGDDELLGLARRAKNGKKFAALFDEGAYAKGSQSEADLSLCCLLAFWFNRDPEAVDRVFRRSRLYRGKWDERRGETTYGAMTIAKAVAYVEDVYSPPDPDPAAAAGGGPDAEPIVVQASTLPPEPVEWLWPNRVPRGFISIFAGRTGIGKSFVTIDIVARVTTGGEWPDLPGECSPTGNVLILSEDPQKQVLVPRLMASGADLDKIWFMTWSAMSRYTLVNTEMLGQAVGMSGDPLLIIIDPPTNFMGAVDEHRNAEVRAVLMFLVAWLESRPSPVAMILITHVSKAAKGVDAIARVIGSVAWVSTSRISHVFAPDPDAPGHALFLSSKNNLGPLAQGLAYRVAKTETFARVEWLGAVSTSADDAMSGEKKKSVKVGVMEWLADRFRERRKWRSDDLKHAALGAGYSYNAVFKEAPITPAMIRKRKISEPGQATYWEWQAQPGWPAKKPPERTESSESCDVTPCDVNENRHSGGEETGPKAAANGESLSSELSDRGGGTFGTDSRTTESSQNPLLPTLYDPSFGTFGSFGSSLVGASNGPDRLAQALRFLTETLHLDREIPRSLVLKWALNSGISESDLLNAVERLGVTRTLDNGGELWRLQSQL